jgi:uncharacterized protein (DUF305 family)
MTYQRALIPSESLYIRARELGWWKPESGAPWGKSGDQASVSKATKAGIRKKRTAQMLQLIKKHHSGIDRLAVVKLLKMSNTTVREIADELARDGKIEIRKVTKPTKTGATVVVRLYPVKQ